MLYCLSMEKRHIPVISAKQLTGDNKELMLIPDAVHTDLYDRVDIIPFDKMACFFNTYLK